MPTIEVSKKDLCKLIEKNIPIEKLKEDIMYAKGEIEEVKGDLLKIEIKDTNRPELWSAEGVAREIAGRYGKPGLPKYKVIKSNVIVNVKRTVKSANPLTVCAVVKNVKMNKAVLSQLIQLQEKVADTFGRGRKEASVGVYDLKKIKLPITYTTVKPDGIKFVPLDGKKEMTPREILKNHPKGKQYAHLLDCYKEYPIFIDAADNVLSIPPIINSDFTGKVNEKTRNLFIEFSGFNFIFLQPALNAIVCALADRGGKIGSVKVNYGNKKIVTPDLREKKIIVDIDYVNKRSGFDFGKKSLKKLLEAARYGVKVSGKKITLTYPAYRQDIMHPADVVEDILISYGYNNIEPVKPKIATTGGQDKRRLLLDGVSDIIAGLGAQEILSYTMTNKKNLFKKMNLSQKDIVEIGNPISANWDVFRSWLMPSVLDFLVNNRHVDYPQAVYEIGDVVLLDKNRETRTIDKKNVCMALTDSKVSYEKISSYLDSLMRGLGVKYKLVPVKHKSFVEGRTAAVFVNNKDIGIIGEVHPQVLQSWRLEKPIISFEVNLDSLYELIYK